jgi:hypothetical protein
METCRFGGDAETRGLVQTHIVSSPPKVLHSLGKVPVRKFVNMNLRSMVRNQ